MMARLRWPTVRELRVAVPLAIPILLLSVFVLRGCSTANVPLVHPPPGVTLPAAAATSTPQDLTGVELAGVNGTTTPVPVAAGGTSHMNGSVAGPQGALPGATVRVEHLVAGNPPPIDVLTGPDGRWDLTNIAGGRYRVRSFLPPSFAQTQPEIFFLTDGEQRTLDLVVESFVGVSLAAAIAPDPPQLNQPLTFVVRVARKTVDPSGVVRSQPVVNAGVALTGTQGWSVRGSSSVFTDANGDAAFTIDCRSTGASQLQVAVRPTPTDPPQAATLAVTACNDPGATTTTPPSSGSGPPPTASGPPPN
ncbi:MAG: Carboxypeptidase regulatory-like domain [Acidimicrobiaceae bacterium]|jgi:hypothetical protein